MGKDKQSEGSDAVLGNSLSARVLEQLFDHSPDVVFFNKDPSGCYRAVNDSLVKCCGYKHKSKRIGKRSAEVFPGELSTVPSAQDYEVLPTRQPVLNKLHLH